MNTPVIADNKPSKVTLKKGKEYYFCTCGKSTSQPFCDGSHAGTSFTPKPFTAEDDGEAYLCACKQSANLPFCDGTHKNFTTEQVGKEAPASTQKSTATEPTLSYIHELARNGLSKLGHHGTMTSMGVPRYALPHWDDLQVIVAQMTTKPLQEDRAVNTQLIIGTAGIATQKESLRKNFNIEKSSKQLHNFFSASTELMQVMARACGHDNLNKFNKKDLATWQKEMAELSGVKYSGFTDISR